MTYEMKLDERFAEGVREKAIQVAQSALGLGLSVDVAAKLTGLPTEEIARLSQGV